MFALQYHAAGTFPAHDELNKESFTPHVLSVSTCFRNSCSFSLCSISFFFLKTKVYIFKQNLITIREGRQTTISYLWAEFPSLLALPQSGSDSLASLLSQIPQRSNTTCSKNKATYCPPLMLTKMCKTRLYYLSLTETGNIPNSVFTTSWQ